MGRRSSGGGYKGLGEWGGGGDMMWEGSGSGVIVR